MNNIGSPISVYKNYCLNLESSLKAHKNKRQMEKIVNDLANLDIVDNVVQRQKLNCPTKGEVCEAILFSDDEETRKKKMTFSEWRQKPSRTAKEKSKLRTIIKPPKRTRIVHKERHYYNSSEMRRAILKIAPAEFKPTLETIMEEEDSPEVESNTNQDHLQLKQMIMSANIRRQPQMKK